MSAENEALLYSMKVKTAELNVSFETVRSSIEELEEIQNSKLDSYVKAKVIHPNTIIKFGDDVHTVNSELTNIKMVSIKKDSKVSLFQAGTD
jgi:hypothetical protein